MCTCRDNLKCFPIYISDLVYFIAYLHQNLTERLEQSRESGTDTVNGECVVLLYSSLLLGVCSYNRSFTSAPVVPVELAKVYFNSAECVASFEKDA